MNGCRCRQQDAWLMDNHGQPICKHKQDARMLVALPPAAQIQHMRCFSSCLVPILYQSRLDRVLLPPGICRLTWLIVHSL